MRELPPAASEVLRRVRQAHDPSSADVARSLSRLQASLSFGVDGAQAAAQVAQPAAAATPHVGGALLTAKAIKLCVVVVALGGAISGGILGSRAPAAPTQTEAALVVGPALGVRPAVEAAEPAAQRDELQLAPDAPEAAGPTRKRAQRKAPSLPRVAARAVRHEERPLPVQAAELGSDGIATPPATATPSELDLIDRAATSLRDGQLSQALRLLDEHRAHYPEGLLRTERQGLRVLALCGLGHLAQARDARRDFLRDAESTPLAARVRRACAAPRQP